MKRQLSARELILLGMLLVLVVVGGYVMLFYLPMNAESWSGWGRRRSPVRSSSRRPSSRWRTSGAWSGSWTRSSPPTPTR